ncbi:hypothetical protein, partial [Salmonella enterica]|uniref:hypothetical protein n=1 Tax=Salmonella enterica TaxID=28901 RepID=UPI000B9F7BB4
KQKEKQKEQGEEEKMEKKENDKKKIEEGGCRPPSFLLAVFLTLLLNRFKMIPRPPKENRHYCDISLSPVRPRGLPKAPGYCYY